MNTNTKGVKGLIKVIDNLQELGYYNFLPFDDHSPVDLIAMSKEGQTYRLQIKYRSLIKRKKSQRYGIKASSVVNGKVVMINRDLIDGWAVYLEEHKKVVYIQKSVLEGKQDFTINPETDYGTLAEWSMAPSC